MRRAVVLRARRRKIGGPVDVLDCGHELPARGGRPTHRSCPQCAANEAAKQEPLPHLSEPTTAD